ncbi:hypothetical protein [Arthrobacter sp. StoSoilB13]|nr:hypothetical protein [Arthrobacter sp. StoSoilB13]
MFTSEHIEEIARLSEILPATHPSPTANSTNPSARLIGTRARNRLVS